MRIGQIINHDIGPSCRILFCWVVDLRSTGDSPKRLLLLFYPLCLSFTRSPPPRVRHEKKKRKDARLTGVCKLLQLHIYILAAEALSPMVVFRHSLTNETDSIILTEE